MTDRDITEDDFNYDAFQKWAFKMLQSGRCMRVQCPEYRSYDGPTAINDNCRKCFKEKTA